MENYMKNKILLFTIFMAGPYVFGLPSVGHQEVSRIEMPQIIEEAAMGNQLGLPNPPFNQILPNPVAAQPQQFLTPRLKKIFETTFWSSAIGIIGSGLVLYYRDAGQHEPDSIDRFLLGTMIVSLGIFKLSDALLPEGR